MKFSNLLNLSTGTQKEASLKLALSKLSFGIDKKASIKLAYVPEVSEFMSQKDDNNIPVNSNTTKLPMGFEDNKPKGQEPNEVVDNNQVVNKCKKRYTKLKTKKSELILAAIPQSDLLNLSTKYEDEGNEDGSENTDPEIVDPQSYAKDKFEQMNSIVPLKKAIKLLRNRLHSQQIYYPTIRTGLQAIFNIASELNFELNNEDLDAVEQGAAQIDRIYENMPNPQEVVKNYGLKTNFPVRASYNDIDIRGEKDDKKKEIILVVYFSDMPVTDRGNFEVQAYIGH